ncbi:hypothetical protein [Oceanobacillus kimchii]|uniref:Phage protein n=1 Tax=Oceanobacillus kimchii TaxID=746691 RepID=A0ABQ5TGV9_9BACI|nr:hypothetical protein [Oceanobacillus kimchii]GLO66108.1 hypothetical protein MACH08_18920 [Oceanobacillus kimchii]
MNSYKEYMELLTKTYDEAVSFLLNKYGSAKDDYFRESSYQRFMNGEIKNITKGKTTRTNEGLYCHHIDQIRWLNISDQNFVKRYNIPFENQRKDRLVYCDLLEHTILHVLIAKETSSKFGFLGYDAYLKKFIEEWYLDEIMPSRDWMKRCFHKSFLVPEKAFNLIKEMQEKLGQSYYNNLEDYYETKKKIKEDRIKKEQQLKQERINLRNRRIEHAKQLHYKSSRADIVNANYLIRIEKSEKSDIMDYDKENLAFKEYESKMKKYTKEKILDELITYIKNEPKFTGEEDGKKL